MKKRKRREEINGERRRETNETKERKKEREREREREREMSFGKKFKLNYFALCRNIAAGMKDLELRHFCR